ncbi:hypothetical protein D3C80_1696730 [compost metagenome]
MLHHRLFIMQPGVARPLRIVHRPAAFPIEDNRHPRLDPATGDRCHGGQQPAQFAHLFADAGIQPPGVVNHRAVELLHRAAAFAPLEVLYRIRTVRDRL